MNTILFSHALPRQLDSTLYQSLYSILHMWVAGHTLIHNEDSNWIPKCLAMLPHSDMSKYANSYIVTTFRAFSFEHPL